MRNSNPPRGVLVGDLSGHQGPRTKGAAMNTLPAGTPVARGQSSTVHRLAQLSANGRGIVAMTMCGATVTHPAYVRLMGPRCPTCFMTMRR